MHRYHFFQNEVDTDTFIFLLLTDTNTDTCMFTAFVILKYIK